MSKKNVEKENSMKNFIVATALILIFIGGMVHSSGSTPVSINEQLSGRPPHSTYKVSSFVKTVGTGGDFANITAALNAYNVTATPDTMRFLLLENQTADSLVIITLGLVRGVLIIDGGVNGATINFNSPSPSRLDAIDFLSDKQVELQFHNVAMTVTQSYRNFFNLYSSPVQTGNCTVSGLNVTGNNNIENFFVATFQSHNTLFTLTNSTVTGVQYAGDLLISDTSSVVVSGCSFTFSDGGVIVSGNNGGIGSVSIHDNIFDGRKTAEYGIGVALWADRVSMDNNTIHGCKTWGLDLNLRDRVVSITNNHIDSAKRPLKFVAGGLRGDSITISGNTLNGYAVIGLDISGGFSSYGISGAVVNISTNTVDDAGLGGQEGIYVVANAFSSLNMDGNIINGSHINDGVYLDGALGWVPALAAKTAPFSFNQEQNPAQKTGAERKAEIAAKVHIADAEDRLLLERIAKNAQNKRNLVASGLKMKGKKHGEISSKQLTGDEVFTGNYSSAISISNNSIVAQIIDNIGINVDNGDFLYSVKMDNNSVTNSSTQNWGLGGIAFITDNIPVLSLSGNTISGFDFGILTYSTNNLTSSYGNTRTMDVNQNTITTRNSIGVNITSLSIAHISLLYTVKGNSCTANSTQDTTVTLVNAGYFIDAESNANYADTSDHSFNRFMLNNNTGGAYIEGAYVLVRGMDSTYVTGNTFNNNGIGLEYAGSVSNALIVANNTITNSFWGIESHLAGNGFVSDHIFNNNVTGSAQINLFVLADPADIAIHTNMLIEHNTFSQSAQEGMYLELNDPFSLDTVAKHANITLRFNTIINNGRNGLMVFNRTNNAPTVEYNNIFGNGLYDVFLPDSFAYNNGQNYFVYYSAKNVNAQYNYWGAASTTEMNSGTNPKNISRIYDHYDKDSLGEVDYAHWLSRGIPAKATGIIIGTVLYDKDKDGVQDTSDTPIAHRVIRLSGASADSDYTDSSGSYTLFPFSTGTYSVMQIVPSDWRQSFPLNSGVYSISHSSGGVYTGKVFLSFYDPMFRSFRSTIDIDQNYSAKPAKLSIKRGKIVISGNLDDRTAVENVFSKLGKNVTLTFGVPNLSREVARTHGWLSFKSGSVLGKFLSPRNDANAYPIDSITHNNAPQKGKPYVKAISPERKKVNNELWGEGIILKLNIEASSKGVTPANFGLLTLDTAITLMGRDLQGVTLIQAAGYVDTLMTFWNDGRHIWGTDNWNELSRFASVLKRINDGFYAPMDTLTADQRDSISRVGIAARNPYALLLGGAKRVSEAASFLKYLPDGKQMVGEAFTEQQKAEPSTFVLYQNYPNPFNPNTVIRYSLSVNSIVSLKVFNILGQQVATLLNNEEVEQGSHEIEFNASNLSSGVYFYRLDVNNGAFTQTKKLVLMK